MLTIDNWIVVWNPPENAGRNDDIRVVEMGDDRAHETVRWPYSAGNVANREAMTRAKKVEAMLTDFIQIVTIGGIDPQAAHREFLKIDEYRRRIVV